MAIRNNTTKFSKITAAALLNLFESKIAPLDPPSPKTPTIEQNIKWIGQPVAEISPLEICDRMSPTLKSTGGGPVGPKFRVLSLEQTRRVGDAKSERPRLTNGEIIFEEFQPM